ncbi:ribokinase [Nocardia sp. NBC_01329]|uniref:ribokinase n=1 Tax=Nocardia sp. NBC_01329 TaxID=2903594 RepID=UPI002E0F2F67|nr:ribokinase [Nocardia sp. NBC_01329]
MTAPLIAVLGSINMDLVTTTDRRPDPGETVLGRGFAMVPGGKGANQAIAASRAGGLVLFLGAIGTDVFGPQLRAVLTASGVDTTGLRTLDGPSGVASIVVDSAGENSIVVVGGANAELTGLGAADRTAIAAADILLCQLEIPIPTIEEAVRHARDNGTVVMLNPSPAQRLSEELWGLVDVAVVNRGEAEELGGTLDRVPHLVVTLGADGARHRGPDGAETAVTGPAVEVVDTTGAGDTFAGALAVRWSRGPAEALRFACAAGALATTVLGASAAIPSRAEIETALSAAPGSASG